MTKTRHFFPGGNTTKGFYSFFDYILEHESANHIYSLKGGPGTGKSSIMRKISNYFLKKGYAIEYHHCSSDPDSLDAISIPELKVALMDGTAPHIIDPKTPGAIDDIINLGVHWDETKLVEHKEKILANRKRNSLLFRRAYSYLKAAGEIYQIYEVTAYQAFDVTKLQKEHHDILNDVLKDYPIQNSKGKIRELFAFGITPNGIVHFREDYFKDKQVIVSIKEGLYSTSESLMNDWLMELKKRGHDIICLRSPIKKDKILEIIVDDIGLIISTDSKYYPLPKDVRHNYELDLNKFEDKNMINHIHGEVNEDINEFDRLLNKAIENIYQAKINHDSLEQYYVDALDFSKHDVLVQNLIQKIESYER